MTKYLVVEVYHIATLSISPNGATALKTPGLQKNQPSFHKMNLVIKLSTTVDLWPLITSFLLAT